MLERIDIVNMPDEARNHWKGIAHFFRALQYFKLVMEFGRVPWFSHSLEISDSTQIYKPLTPTSLVMDSVLADLNFAVANIRQVDLTNTVQKNVALALLARVGLYEGTYRKYHTELNMPKRGYLSPGARRAQAIMTSGTYTWTRAIRTAIIPMTYPDKEIICTKGTSRLS